MVLRSRWEAHGGASAFRIECGSDSGLTIAATGARSSPQELLNASLAMSATHRMARFAQRAKLNVTGLQVEVTHAKVESGLLLTMAICAEGRLSGRQQESLLGIAQGCPIGRVLKGSVRVVILEWFPGSSDEI